MEVRLEKVFCDFCGSSDYDPYDEDGKWKIVKCKSCGFCFTNPRPSIDSLAGYYTEEYYKDKRHVSKFYNPDGTIKEVADDYTNRIEDIEGFVNQRNNILEIGSARGVFLHELKKRGWNVFGVEISQDASDIANGNGIPTFCGEYINYQHEGTIDVICLYQTLEHVYNPKQIIDKAYNDLSQGGIFIAEIPSLDCFEMKYSKSRKHLSYDLPRHLNHFKPEFLTKQMVNAGFEIIEVTNYAPKNLIKFINFINKIKGKDSKTSRGNQTNSGSGKVSDLPLMKKPNHGLSIRFIKWYSSVFPGWRFTIVARKMKLDLEKTNCCFCGESSSTIFGKIGSWKMDKCTNCGHVYTNPRPKKEVLSQLYDKDYYSNQQRFNNQFSETIETKDDADFYKNIQDVESWVTERGRLLEVGCAKGDFLRVMNNRGWKVVGVDISEESIGRGLKENNLDLRCGTIESLTSEERFDAITMYQCLEHMPNAKLAIDKSYEMLNKNGVLVIEVPNLKSFDFKISKKRRFWSYDLPYHLSHFTPSFLTRELEKKGLEVVEVDLYYPNFILSLLRLVSKLKPRKEQVLGGELAVKDNETIKLSKKTSSAKLKLLNFVSRLFPGWRFTIIAKK